MISLLINWLGAEIGVRPLVLGLPLVCSPGATCWVVNYVDVDPAKTAQDFTCGPRSYDGHKGVDFAIRDWVVMEKGVDVVASAPGRVLRVRDDVPDRELTAALRKQIHAANRDCGNGVLIEHEGGWRTMYCHMKQGSVTVRPGQEVKTGDKLGQVGQSGMAEFPHVHLTVTSPEGLVDPFTGLAGRPGCGKTGTSLWSDDLKLAYEPVALYAAGFTPGKPDFAKIRRDASSPEELPADTDVLAFWVYIYGVEKGDKVSIEIRAPDGSLYASHSVTQDRTRARQAYFVGERTRGRLAAGTYTGTATLKRGDDIERHISRTVRINH